MRPDSRGVVIFVLVLILGLSATAQAQRQRRSGTTGESDKQPAPKQDQKPESSSTSASIKLVEPLRADFLSGEANVAVSGNQNPVIRLGLSPNGATIIEFPASDKLFNIIPGNSNLVTIEESPTKATDHFIIARPGDGFASPATMANARRAPATSVMVQMQSGLVMTFLFYPVQQLAEQAHRVVITYDRNEVIAARRASGLAVNLDLAEDDKPRTTSMRVASPSIESSTGSPADSTEVGPARPRTSSKLVRVADTAELDTSQPPEKWRHEDKSDDPARAASLALIEASGSPASFKRWSDSVHGLALSVSPPREIGKRSQLVVIAVRNTQKADACILPGQPEIYLETIDGKGKPLHVEQVKKLAIETTAKDNTIPAGAIRYYALVYETQALGVRQRLRVAVGQTTAADEPATANLTSNR